MPVNQTSHTRPFLPTYNQSVGNTAFAFSQTNLRLPVYRENHLDRYTPYARYTDHRRFFIDDEVPSYNEATVNNTLPSRRQPRVPAPNPIVVDPSQAIAIKNAIKEFFESLSELIVPVEAEETGDATD